MSESKTYPVLGGYVLTQSALLFAQYGMGYSLPWWVRWFPTVILIPFVFLILALMIIAAVVDK